jgi:hypothetical protein
MQCFWGGHAYAYLRRSNLFDVYRACVNACRRPFENLSTQKQFYRRRTAVGALCIESQAGFVSVPPWGSLVQLYSDVPCVCTVFSIYHNVRIPRTPPFFITITTTTSRDRRMTAANRDNPEDDTHCPSSATREEAQCCGNDHQHEEGVPGEAESHCGGGCCGDDEDSDCESNVDPCEDSCCGHHEDHSVHDESAHEKDQRGTEHGSRTRRLVPLTPYQISVARPVQLNPSRAIQVAVTHRRTGMKIRGKSASVFLME